MRDLLTTSVNAEAAAVALIEQIELWSEMVLGHKDHRRAPESAQPEVRSQNSVLLHQINSIYNAHLSGDISDHTWNRLHVVLRTLLSTSFFRSTLHVLDTRFPTDFRDWLRSMKA